MPALSTVVLMKAFDLSTTSRLALASFRSTTFHPGFSTASEKKTCIAWLGKMKGSTMRPKFCRKFTTRKPAEKLMPLRCCSFSIARYLNPPLGNGYRMPQFGSTLWLSVRALRSTTVGPNPLDCAYPEELHGRHWPFSLPMVEWTGRHSAQPSTSCHYTHPMIVLTIRYKNERPPSAIVT